MCYPMFHKLFLKFCHPKDHKRSYPCQDLSISASPTACPLCGYGRAGTQSDLLCKERGGHFQYRHAHTRAMDMPSVKLRYT